MDDKARLLKDERDRAQHSVEGWPPLFLLSLCVHFMAGFARGVVVAFLSQKH